MSSFVAKVYVIQRYSKDGVPGDVIGMKLTRGAAQELAKAYAPAKVIFGIADKTPLPNVEPFQNRET